MQAKHTQKSPRRRRSKDIPRCTKCGIGLPKTATYREAVQLRSEIGAKIWKYFCEECLDEISEPYETKMDFEYRTRRTEDQERSLECPN